jgi:hypothetical protein
VRRAARKDGNQGLIVEALRRGGRSVVVLNQRGISDLLVGGRCCACGSTHNDLLEIKQRGFEGDLTPAQIEFMLSWKGPVHVVSAVDEALDRVGLVKLVVENSEKVRR